MTYLVMVCISINFVSSSSAYCFWYCSGIWIFNTYAVVLASCVYLQKSYVQLISEVTRILKFCAIWRIWRGYL